MEAGRGVIARAAGLMFRPGRTWDAVADEPTDARALIIHYVAPLAAIPAVCGVVGPLIFGGYSIAHVGVHESVVSLILGAVVGYVLFVAAAWTLGVVIGWIAPAFGGEAPRGEGIKVAAYGATAVCVAGVGELYPSLGLPLGILAALYSLYGLYLGLAKVMRAPEERRLTAFALLLFVILGLAIVRGALVAKAKELGGPLSASYAPR